jgi:hypothetical protein
MIKSLKQLTVVRVKQLSNPRSRIIPRLYLVYRLSYLAGFMDFRMRIVYQIIPLSH